MKARLTITDVTRMQGGRVCVAGYLPDDTCVRPVLRSGGLAESWLKARGEVIIRPFVVVEFEFHEKRGDPPHTEDRLIDPIYRQRRGALAPAAQQALLHRIKFDSVDQIFRAPIHHEPGWYIMAGEGERSLGTIVPARVGAIAYDERAAGKWEYHLAFTDASGAEYRLSVTDLAFRRYLDHLRCEKHAEPVAAAECLAAALQGALVFLRIGLARGWAKYPERCYLQITGVYAYPDYLDGRCFDDFAPSNQSDGV
jgi:hypothetical protein